MNLLKHGRTWAASARSVLVLGVACVMAPAFAASYGGSLEKQGSERTLQKVTLEKAHSDPCF